MARANLNSQSKRKRELAKKDKRAAKDEKRAARKAEARVERAVADGTPLPTVVTKTVPGAVAKWAAAKPAPSSAAAKWAAARPAATNVRSIAAAAFIRRMNKTP
jgi:hypothetical protein